MSKVQGRFMRNGLLLAALALLTLVAFAAPALAAGEWQASYWNNMTLSGPPVYQRIEAQTPDIGWGNNSPVPGIVQADEFSARWVSNQHFDPGLWRFSVRADDGVRLWLDGRLIVDQWHDSTGETYNADVDIATTGPKQIMMEFYDKGANAGIHLNWERLGATVGVNDWRAEYFNNVDLSGTPALVRAEGGLISHDWGTRSPGPGVNADGFSARYQRSVNLAPGRYRLTATADDGVRVWMNGQLVIDDWRAAGTTTSTADVDWPGGVANFVVNYFENAGNAKINTRIEKLEDGFGGSGGTGGSGGGFGGSGGSGGSGGGFGGSGGTGGSGSGYGGAGGSGTEATTATVNTTAVYMRSGPGSNFEPIGSLTLGTVVQLSGLHQDHWVNVRAPNGVYGWVDSRYLDYDLPVFPSG